MSVARRDPRGGAERMTEVCEPAAGHGRPGAPGPIRAEIGQDGWVSVSDAAQQAGVSTSAVRQWYRSGKLPTRRRNGPGSAFLVPLDEAMRLAHPARRKADVGDDTLDDSTTDLGAEARAVARARDLHTTLESMAERLAAAEQSRATAIERAEAAERLLEESRQEAASLRRRLEESVAALDERRNRSAQLEEQLRVLRSFASVTDHSWVGSDVPGYKGPARDQTGPAEPVPGVDETERPGGPGRAGRHEGDIGEIAEAGPPVPEPFAIDELGDGGAEPGRRPQERPRRVDFDFGHKADDLLPEDTGKRRRR